MGQGSIFGFWQKKNNSGTKEMDSKEMRVLLDEKKMPAHVAIIMDGNGRWAKRRGLPRITGHRAGVNAIRKTVEMAIELKIPYLTVYAFSTENWKRSSEEVNALMQLLQEFLQKEVKEMHEKQIRVNAIGEIEELPHYAYEELQRAMDLTKDNTGLHFTLALNYGARSEIVSATKKVVQDVVSGKLDLEELNEENFSNYLFTREIPDPELLIRTSGELRLSNFLLWQIAYTEIWVTSVFWPDFTEKEFLRAILSYQKRDRRFGAVN